MKTVEWSQCTSSNPSFIVVLPLAVKTKQVISLLSKNDCLISVCVLNELFCNFTFSHNILF